MNTESTTRSMTSLRPVANRLALAAVVPLALAALCMLSPGELAAQAGQPPRRQEPIEIRGQVPTPQVVTVRPREAPAFSRKVLVPAFYDRDFWPSILPPLQIVSSGGVPRADSVARPPADSVTRPATPPAPATPPSSRPAADSASRATPVAPRPPSGTPPAHSLRR
jgi:hypothetical protein